MSVSSCGHSDSVFSQNSLVGVIHVVVNGVQARLTRARIAANGAARGRASLGRGISDEVTVPSATTLECVIEAEPVTDFMGCCLSEVEAGSRSAWHSLCIEGDAVTVECRAPRRHRGREVCIAKGVALKANLEVDVQVLVRSLAQSSLHSEFVVVNGPARVDSAISAEKIERNVMRGKIGIHDCQLIRQHGIL